jgi:hypothetical protein
MDDNHANPMKTGLMFVPLGLVSSDFPGASPSRDHLAELKADIDLGVLAPTPAPSTKYRWSLRRLLGRIGDIARVPWARTGVTTDVHPLHR